MKNETIDKLCNKIIKLEGKWDNGAPRIIIKDFDRDIVTQTIRNFLSTTDEERELAELRAKVYTYEKIIANSNFAPLIELEPKTDSKNEVIEQFVNVACERISNMTICGDSNRVCLNAVIECLESLAEETTGETQIKE